MSNWDDEDWEAPGAGAPPSLPSNPTGNWDDEDLSDDEPAVVLKKPSAPMKQSKALKLALKAKEAEEQRLETERLLERERKMNEMSAVERKMEQQRIVEEADMDNTRDLFMDGGSGEGGMAPPAEPTLDNFKPVTDADFGKFARMVGDRCAELNTNPKKTLRYVQFVKDVMRGLTRDLGPDDTKELSTYMGFISNEKRDQVKKQRGVKKKTNKKGQVRVDRADDMRNDTYDDFADDFM
eukprot:GFKZ01013998.1.p1 GENE.GFKZ01013998.1~~GFKZ01013998.1.p1  ORF type:complete len:238 (-),score=68.26 GFKZ01013998.1:884-1597(-)